MADIEITTNFVVVDQGRRFPLKYDPRTGRDPVPQLHERLVNPQTMFLMDGSPGGVLIGYISHEDKPEKPLNWSEGHVEVLTGYKFAGWEDVSRLVGRTRFAVLFNVRGNRLNRICHPTDKTWCVGGYTADRYYVWRPGPATLQAIKVSGLERMLPSDTYIGRYRDTGFTYRHPSLPLSRPYKTREAAIRAALKALKADTSKERHFRHAADAAVCIAEGHMEDYYAYDMNDVWQVHLEWFTATGDRLGSKTTKPIYTLEYAREAMGPLMEEWLNRNRTWLQQQRHVDPVPERQLRALHMPDDVG